MVPKIFLFASREDFILKNQLESISAQGEENLDFTVKSNRSNLPTPTPPNSPCFPIEKVFRQRQQSCLEHGNSVQTDPDKLSSSMESRSQVNSSTCRLLEHWKAVAIDSQKENQMLKSQIIEVEVQNRNLIDARSRREMMSRDPRETIVYGLLQQSWQQSQHIKELEKDATFKNMDGQYEVRLGPKQINAFMEKMKVALESMMHKNGIRLLWPALDTMEANSDLQSLLYLLFETWTNLELARTRKDLDPQLLLRGLALAAVKQWVFMTDFPGFKENRLSRAQIKAMSQRGGWKCARNLALASYISIIRDPSFPEEDLREQTQNLVLRFSRALAPLCRSPHDSEKILSDMWVDAEGTVGALFNIALTFKAGTVATEKQYEFIVYPPGTPGTPAAGAIPIAENLSVPKQSGKETVCEAWKHASLYVYEVESSSERNDFANALVKPSNFILREADVREKRCCLKSVMMISKEFDESHWDADEEIGSIEKAQLGEDTMAVDIGKEQKVNTVAGDASNVMGKPELVVKNILQSGVEAPIGNRTGKYPQKRSGQRSETALKSPNLCSICLSAFSATVFEEHLKNRPAWCQPPCSACGGKFSRSSDIAKHQRHQKKENTKEELGCSERGEASGLDILAELARKQTDVTSVAPEKPHSHTTQMLKTRRSMRLNAQDDIAPEMEGDIVPDVEDDNTCDPSTAGKTGLRSANLKSPKCEKCGVTFKSIEGLAKHRRAKACKICPLCGNWFGCRKLSRHGCTKQKATNPDYGQMPHTESNGTGEHQASTATKQVSPRTSEDSTKTQADPVCSQADSSLYGEIEKFPIPAEFLVQDSPKRPRSCENQYRKELQTPGDGFVHEEAEGMRPSKLRCLKVMQKVATEQECPRFGNQSDSRFDDNHAQAPNPSQFTTFEFDQWQPFTPQESNERGLQDLNSNYIAFGTQDKTFIKNCRYPLDVPQAFQKDSYGFPAMRGENLNEYLPSAISGQRPAYQGHHTVTSNMQPQGLTHPMTSHATSEGGFGDFIRRSGNTITDLLNADLPGAEGVGHEN
ncbi:hypothetical protein SBOR_2779 [Sclerotinia borealis F-4128]|uniref:C2H2-type domain-containing protein n=1 Tax=Sclerotinia borealis (strain F-4128) TaxID=1432307 RepID=W9CLH0_SCLBF|nr:hypothetical protein SBOR_2779 [Sclerotinia borealis F-4128]